MNKAKRILEHAWFSGDLSPLGDGHINDTYLVTNSKGNFVFQKINSSVFNTPLNVVRNYETILPYLKRKNINVAPVVQSRFGTNVFVDDDGEVWRLHKYVEHSKTLQCLETSQQAQNTGLAFAKFQSALTDLPNDSLHEVIPKFLQLGPYLKALDAALERSNLSDKTILEVLLNNRHLEQALGERMGAIHGDCKVNNLRFDANDDVCCVLDLDTVMFGHPAWDWGDLARSGVMGAADSMKFEVLAALAKGFRQAVNVSASELVLAPQYVAFMLGVRFLTDHLLGDVYFKVQTAGDNLLRAREQFELLHWFQGCEKRLKSLC